MFGNFRYAKIMQKGCQKNYLEILMLWKEPFIFLNYIYRPFIEVYLKLYYLTLNKTRKSLKVTAILFFPITAV